MWESRTYAKTGLWRSSNYEVEERYKSTEPVIRKSGKEESLWTGDERCFTSILKLLSSGPLRATFMSPGCTCLNKRCALHVLSTDHELDTVPSSWGPSVKIWIRSTCRRNTSLLELQSLLQRSKLKELLARCHGLYLQPLCSRGQGRRVAVNLRPTKAVKSVWGQLQSKILS